MGASAMSRKSLEDKAIKAVIDELERQAAERPSKLEVRRSGEKVTVNGEVDIDAVVMVIVGSMAGGP